MYIRRIVSGGDTSIASLPDVQSSLKDCVLHVKIFNNNVFHTMFGVLPSGFWHPVISYIFDQCRKEVLRLLIIYP